MDKDDQNKKKQNPSAQSPTNQVDHETEIEFSEDIVDVYEREAEERSLHEAKKSIKGINSLPFLEMAKSSITIATIP